MNSGNELCLLLTVPSGYNNAASRRLRMDDLLFRTEVAAVRVCCCILIVDVVDAIVV